MKEVSLPIGKIRQRAMHSLGCALLHSRRPRWELYKRTSFRRLSYIIRHRAIFPGLDPSIVTAARLNCCVRNGNRCFPSAMGTDQSIVPPSLLPAKPDTRWLLANCGVGYVRLLARRTFSTTCSNPHCLLALYSSTKFWLMSKAITLALWIEELLKQQRFVRC